MKAVLTLHIISSILFNRRRPCWQWSKPDYPILSILFLLMFSGNLRRQGISRHGIVSHSWNIPSQASLKMSNVGSSLSLEGTQMNVLYSIICEYCIIFGVWSQSQYLIVPISNLSSSAFTDMGMAHFVQEHTTALWYPIKEHYININTQKISWC